ncbi:MAG: tetratricopeptide repeat protein [Burkholderiales bacterium]|nr:tetratricopeptide repeat protein [Burkholderiales bacterium]
MSFTVIQNLEKLIGTPRDGALLRYCLGSEHLKAGEPERAAERLREALERDRSYSAAWKLLGRALTDCGRPGDALQAYREGIEAAQARGDIQAAREMKVFARRLDKALPGSAHGGGR